MKKTTHSLFIVILILCSRQLSAQNQDDMKVMMAYMTPGSIHQMLAKSVGTWSGSIQMWMQPGTPPMSMTGETKSEMILGGRYLKSTNTGNMMGMDFEGIGTVGYDNAKKVFVSSWIDNMGTGMMYLEGAWDDQTKSINFNGKMVDPVSGTELPVREIVRIVDDNNQVMEMYLTVKGKEYKSMEIKYTRK